MTTKTNIIISEKKVTVLCFELEFKITQISSCEYELVIKNYHKELYSLQHKLLHELTDCMHKIINKFRLFNMQHKLIMKNSVKEYSFNIYYSVIMDSYLYTIQSANYLIEYSYHNSLNQCLQFYSIDLIEYSNKYNGWSNYETWVTNLHFDDYHDIIQDKIQDLHNELYGRKFPEYTNYKNRMVTELADFLQGIIEIDLDDNNLNTLSSDLCRNDLIDYREIASHYISDWLEYNDNEDN